MTDLFAGIPESQQPSGGCLDMPYSLDRAITAFLNRWIPRVLNAEHRPTIERELRELIAEAVK